MGQDTEFSVDSLIYEPTATLLDFVLLYPHLTQSPKNRIDRYKVLYEHGKCLSQKGCTLFGVGGFEIHPSEEEVGIYTAVIFYEDFNSLTGLYIEAQAGATGYYLMNEDSAIKQWEIRMPTSPNEYFSKKPNNRETEPLKLAKVESDNSLLHKYFSHSPIQRLYFARYIFEEIPSLNQYLYMIIKLDIDTLTESKTIDFYLNGRILEKEKTEVFSIWMNKVAQYGR
ncbi:MAG: hypothetical protein AAF740_00015 [Bacteroidota bacterium]